MSNKDEGSADLESESGVEQVSESESGVEPVVGSTEGTFIPEESFAEIFDRDSSRRLVKYCTSLFLVVGLGFSFASLAESSVVGTLDTSEGISGVGLVLGIVQALRLTPLLGVLSGVLVGLRLDESRYSICVTAAAGSLLGYLGLLVVAGIGSALVGDEAVQLGIGISEELPGWLGYGLGVAVAGYIAGYLTDFYLVDAS